MWGGQGGGRVCCTKSEMAEVTVIIVTGTDIGGQRWHLLVGEPSLRSSCGFCPCSNKRLSVSNFEKEKDISVEPHVSVLMQLYLLLFN